MIFSSLPAADHEALQAALWYESKQKGLGIEFTRELRRNFKNIKDNPNRFRSCEWAIDASNVRRCIMQGFPYTIIFRVQNNNILIVAISHMSRRPDYWRKRLH